LDRDPAGGLARFWTNPGGCALAEAVALVSAARLDRIVAFANSLRR